ncbi:MAG: flagellar hook-length control protein FliK [Treponema sp.]|nr:flagellar hook-length control protein FliK [Treponema sp.]
MTQLSPQIQNELFPGAAAFLSRPDIPAGPAAGISAPGALGTPDFAGRFAALFDMAAREAALPGRGTGVGTAFAAPENTLFPPALEADRLYNSRPPDTARPFSPDAAPAPEYAPVSGESDSPRADGGAGVRPEEAATEPQEEAAGSRPESFALKGRRAKAAESAGGAEAERAGRGRGRPRANSGVSGEDSGGIPGFGEGIPADAAPGVNPGPALAVEPEGAGEADRPAPRPARSGGSEKAGEAEKPGREDVSPTLPAASHEAAPEIAAAGAGGAGADTGLAETAGLAAEGERPAQDAGLAGAETEAARAGMGDAAAELAVLPRQQKSLSPERPEKGDREEPGEARKSERRRERFNLELRDFRTTPRIEDSVDGTAGTKGGDAENSGTPDHGQEQEIIVDLKSQARSQAEVSYNRENRGRISFRETLARELHENLNGDIVRHASVVLKNGGEGLIRLSLRPEHLGNVKIRLEMSENKVVGRIVVESNEALRAFEQELRSLEQAFVDSGFEGAALEMSVASGGGQGGSGAYQEDGETGPFFSERPAARSYDAASGVLDAAGAMWLSAGESQVNVLA